MKFFLVKFKRSAYRITLAFLSIFLFFSGDYSEADKNFSSEKQHISSTISLTKFSGDSILSPLISSVPISYSIPLKRIGRLYAIEAVIDGETGNLIFDSGATNLVLNRAYFRDHVVNDEINSSGITGSTGLVERITVNTIEIGELKYIKESANLANLGHIENKRGIKVLGLFGFDLIKSFEITLDVNNSRLILNPIDNKGNLIQIEDAFKADITRRLEIANNVIFLKANIGEKPLRFCFDTGAETNALSSSLNKTILSTVTVTKTVKLKGSGSASVEVIYGQMNNFQIGDSIFNSMETIITYMDHLNEAYGIRIDGVLGFDFISKANFNFNFVKQSIGISFLKQAEQ